MDLEFGSSRFENLLKAGIVGSPEIWRHAHPDQQHRYRLGLGELYHLPQVFRALLETQSLQPVVATELDNQVSGLMLRQQSGQALQAAISCFPTNAGINNACLRKTCPYIGAEQLRPALVYRYIMGGAQTVA